MLAVAVLMSILAASNQQIFVNPQKELVAGLPSGILLFVPSDQCKNGSYPTLAAIASKQQKTIEDMTMKVSSINEICPNVGLAKTTPKPTEIPPAKCLDAMKTVVNETSTKLVELGVKLTASELRLEDMKKEYQKNRAIRSRRCVRPFDGIGEGQIVHQVYERHGRIGAWMKDPKADDNKVWVMAGYSGVNQLVEYETESHLIANQPTKTYTIPNSCDGTGHVVYNGAFYCNQYNTDDIMRFDLKTQKVIYRDLPTFTGRYYHSSYGYPGSYQWTLYNGIDFAADELGLWVIYVNPDHSRRQLTFSKIDPDNLNILHSWRTSVQKRSYGEAFLVCGKLYTMASYSSTSNYVSYSYDSVTFTAKSFPSSQIPFHTYKYDHQFSSLSYNSKERALYAWHYYSGSLIRYPLLSSFQ